MAIPLSDARLLSDDALQALRLRALHGLELGYSEVELAALLGVRHETISRWRSAYRADGLAALPGGRTGRPLGSGRILSEEQARYICSCIDNYSPQELGVAHALWTRRAVRDLIRQKYDLQVAERTVGAYLRRWGYSSKKPARRSQQQDPEAVSDWLEETYPAIRDQAARENAEILWVDEVGVQADHHPGCGYARMGERATLDVPRPHIRSNQITAISNEGTVRYLTYDGSFTALVFLEFLTRLVAGATSKMLLIADGLQAHKTPAVQAWVKAHRDQIEVYYLPAYAPELNPVEYLNQDMKGNVNKAGLPADRGTLRSRIRSFMGKLAHIPQHVIGYFLHPWARYAAPTELL